MLWRKYKKPVICLNCDREGHTFRKCLMPIKSYGIVAYTKNKNIIKFLLVQRKDSMGYTDFMRGKYKTSDGGVDYEKLQIIIEEMTEEEKFKLLNFSFEELWKEMWLDHHSGIYVKERANAYKMYTSVDFVPMIKNSLPSKYHSTEWGFAKGRKNLNESGLECAIREFKEETGLFDDDFRIIPRFNPVAENFIGSDGIKYSHIYYLAEVKNNIDMRFRSKNSCLLQEVKNIGFFEYRDCYNLFRDYDVQKKFTLTKIREFIIKYACYQKIF